MAPVGVGFAFDQNWNVEDPTWTRIDNVAKVARFTIDRGRNEETESGQPGTAQVVIVDTTGDFDPTNLSGDYYGKFLPRTQAALCLYHPVDAVWHTVFRGFIESVQYEPDVTQDYFTLTVNLVDGQGVIAGIGLQPNGQFGDSVVNDNIVYAEDTATTAVQTRIAAVLTECGWGGTGSSDTLRDIFTGNVGLQETTYASNDSALTVIMDAADAEFPWVSNVFCSKEGVFTFRGRYARFHPDDVAYEIDTWNLGDWTSAEASPATTVRISPPVVYVVDDDHIYNEAYAAPAGIDPTLVDSQVVSDATSIARYGRRTWVREYLRTLSGEAGDGVDEVKQFGQYIVDNYKQPVVRCGALTVKSHAAGTDYTEATWDFLCGVELSDVVHLSTSHSGGGGFDTDFFVEGLHYEVTPMRGSTWLVECRVDTSPKAWFDTNNFVEPA